MRSILLGAVAALGLCPVLASASVAIDIGNTTVTLAGTDQTVPLEVFARDLDNQNERLNAYTIALLGAAPAGQTFGSPTGVRFVVPGSSFGTAGRPTAHPFVFKDLETIPPIENFSSTPSKLQFGSTAIGQDDEVDVTNTLNGFIKFNVIVPANTAAGRYLISVDPTKLSLAGQGAPIVATPGTVGFVDVVPEPASMGLMVLGGVLFLRRRRVA